ncbi:uncharacterized protein sS8_4245 [Methylocaldum marinum]|uniref:DUF2382 domain-containing protein n=1 Tax=Methylocaldum marinum TaxID=1432792 RepID=A0A250KX18_9GAMM|nr:DUF2382 domain-containing protein [Methylocaldum marinum]BBA36175.1 uncharacterized protein sS8_4245 [Methylocaldum marinum]
MMNTVVGLLDTRSEAEKVVHDLEREGIGRDHIHVMTSDVEYERELSGARGAEKESGLRFVLSKLGLLEQRREEIGLPAEDIRYYAEGVRRGGLLVTVETDESHADRAARILAEHGAVDIEERATQWQQPGTTPPAAGRTDTAAEPMPGAPEPARGAEEAKIPVVEEELKVGKRAVKHGGVRVYTHVTERPVDEDVTLREEHVRVERHPVDRPMSEADMAAFKEGSMEFTEMAEEAVASKEARVVEEVTVSKGVTEHTETVHDTLRGTEVEVEEFGRATAGPSPDFASLDSDFRQHYSTHFGNLGQPYDRYLPAYRFGHTLGTHPALAGKDWAALEPEARREWERNPSAGEWDQMKSAIHHAWERVRGNR